MSGDLAANNHPVEELVEFRWKGSRVIDRAGLANEIRRVVDPLILMQRVADEAMTLLEAIEGVFIGFADGAEWLRLSAPRAP